MSDIPELTERDFAKAIPASLRRRLIGGRFESGADVVALRRFVGLPQAQFAHALGVTVNTLCMWEQDRAIPEGPALALLRIAARHPRIVRENIASVA
jgi:DNA-binding transcriptional regulator YiaG